MPLILNWIEIPSERCTRSQPSKCCKRKRASSDRAPFFHCAVFQFWCWPDRSVAMQPHTQRTAMHLYSDTFLSEPTLASSAIWETVVCLLDRTTRARSPSPRATMNLGRPWPCLLFYHRSFFPLQSRNIPQELQFWRCSDRRLAITARSIITLTQETIMRCIYQINGPQRRKRNFISARN